MLLTLGIDSAFSLVEAAETAVEDKWGFGRGKLNLVLCVGGLLIGIVFATQGGLYILDTADEFLNNFGLPVVGLLECLAVGLVYKAARMRREVNEISEVRLGRWWDVFVSFVTPLVLVVLVVLTLAKRISEPYEGYPATLLLIAGWCVLLLTIELALLLAGRKRTAAAVAVAALFVYGLSQLQAWVAMLILGAVVLFGGMGFSLLRMGSKPRHEGGGGAEGQGG
jgi:NSS family neurotransmitter:Na+ symporter